MSVRRVVAVVALATAALALSVCSPRGAAAAATIPLPNSIDASGASDVTAALVKFFAAVPPGSVVEFPTRATYRIDGVVKIKGLRDVTIEGNGSTLVVPTDGRDVAPPKGMRAHWPRTRQHVSMRAVDALVVRDLAIRGPNRSGEYVAALEGQAGFTIAASAHVLLERVAVANVYGDGVYLAGKSVDVTVRGSTFDKIGRQGIAVVNASKVVIEGDRFRDIARSVVDVEPASPRWPVAGVHIQKNEMGDFGNFALAAAGAGSRVSDLWFENNHISGGNGIAIFARAPKTPRAGLHVIGNTSEVTGRLVKGAGQSGVIQVTRIDGVEIIGNRQRVAPGAAAVTVEGVCHLEMRDNAFSGATQAREVIAPCGAKPGTGTTNKKAAPSLGSATARPKPARSSATDSAWLIAGCAGALLVLGVVGAVFWRDRRRPAAPAPE